MKTCRPACRLGCLLIVSCLLIVCQRVPLSGRKQLNFVPDSQLMQLGLEQYSQIKKENPPVSGTPEAEMVQRVGRNIARSVEQYMTNHKMGDRLKGYQWEFNLLSSKDVNAFCLPGGKVGIFEGIMPVTRTEEGLAVVMGHEIAHAIAEHGNERVSQVLLVQLGGMALSVALQQKPEQTRQLFMAAYGIGSQVGVLLPYSRTHEKEADRVGLIFSSMAGYNPAEAVSFWSRMETQEKGARPPEFLSTHPAPKTRIDDIRKMLPEAEKYYRGKKK